MASDPTDKPLGTQIRASEATGFGAYGATANAQPDLTMALDKPPASKTNGSMDFANPDKRWLKEMALTTADPNSHHKAWQTTIEKYHHEHRKWNESYGGRVAIRAVSRGVVGAAFYAAANIYGTKALKGYTRDSKPQGVLQHITRFIDNTAGTAIQKTVTTVTGSAEKGLTAVTFRDTRDYGYGKKIGKAVMGRSLGHEAVSVTFDFASMSFGDYMTRYVIGLMDPNAKKHWMKDGHVDVPAALKDVMANVFRGVTYAAGEDMAVAIPYVYGIRLQRNILNKYSPGFKYDADGGLNGGSYKVKNGKIVGDYQLEGALDLMGRFSWYNVGTKMFRDAYGKVDTSLDNWWNGDRKIHAPHIDPKNFTPTAMATSVAHGVRYVVRTTVKVMAYMIPSTVFFFGSRTPQHKMHGMAIDPELGMLGRMKDGNFKPVKPGSLMSNDMTLDDIEKGDTLFYRGQDKKTGKMVDSKTRHYPFAENREAMFNGELYKQNGTTPPWHDRMTNPIGRFYYHAGKHLNTALQPVGKRMGFSSKTIRKFAEKYVDAAGAYTPYFMVKTDIGSAIVDTTRTDMGLDRGIDGFGNALAGIVTFNGDRISSGFHEFAAGAKESMRSVIGEPFADPKREEIAQREHWSSDPEHISNEAYQLSGPSSRRRNRHTDDTKRNDTGHKVFATDDLKSKSLSPEDLKAKTAAAPATFTQLKKPADNWVNTTTLQKFQEAGPDGQSIH